MAKTNVNNIALFIDFENFDKQDTFDARLLIDKLKERGRIIVKKAYADWGRFAKYKRQMLENSVELIELPSHSKRGKNSADIKLVVDAIELAITKDYIDTLVVVSGDSDYTPLISKLREYDKYVIVVGNKDTISNLLVGYCDELIYYANLLGIVAPDKDDVEIAFKLLVRTVNYLDGEGIVPRSSPVKNYMKQLDASFNEGNYGFSQFNQFLKQAAQQGFIVLEQLEHGNYQIKLRSSRKQAASNPPDIAQPEKLEIIPLILSAIKLNDLEPETGITLSTLATNVRALEPTFALNTYGYTKSQGFKGIIESIEKKNLLRLEFGSNKNTHYVYPAAQFDTYVKAMTRHDNFDQVCLTRRLASRGRLINLQKLNQFVVEATIVFQTANANNVPMTIQTLLTQHYTQTHYDSYETFLSVYKTAINSLLICQAIKDEAGQAIVTRDDIRIIHTLETVDEIFRKYVSLVRSDISTEFGQEIEAGMLGKFLLEYTAKTLIVTDVAAQNQDQPGLSEFQQLLASIRKGNMQFLDNELQDLVLSALYIVIVTAPGELSRQEILSQALERHLKIFAEIGLISKTKIGRVLNILRNVPCFSLSKTDDEGPTCLALSSDYQTYKAFKRAHDIHLVSLALRNTLNIPAEIWAETLLHDRAQIDEARALLQEAQTRQEQHIKEPDSEIEGIDDSLK